MKNRTCDSRIVLTEREFEYVQQMLDYGSTIDQALLQVRPRLGREQWNLKESVIVVQRHSLHLTRMA